MPEIEKLRKEAIKFFNESIDLMQKDEPERALESLSKAEKIAQELKDGAILFHTLKVRGQLLQVLDRYEEALETYTFSLRINEKYLEIYPENKLYLDTLHMNLNNVGNLGNFFQKEEKLQLSKQCYEIGLEISRKRLEFEPENEFYQMYTGNTLNNLGELLVQMGQTDAAKENYNKALEIYENLLKIDPENLEYLSDAVMTLNNLGSLFFENGQRGEGEKSFKRAVEILELLNKKEPENKNFEAEIDSIRKRLTNL
jgi:tetratricopeptide (TPR) repeat protein